jgi:hypothetical protein
MSNSRQFVKYVREQCKLHGVKLTLKKSRYLILSDNARCSGYFDDEARELVVAGNHPEYLSILVHEFAHLTQWVDNCEPWRKLGDSLVKIHDWLGGKEVKGIKRALAKARDLELDNEKRSVKIIKEWNLSIDIKLYTQKANAYVQFYNWMYYTRRWCTVKNSPYRNKKIYTNMPTIFKMNYEEMSEKYKKLYQEAGI